MVNFASLSDSIVAGTNISFKCNTSYGLNSNNSNYNCQENGTWNNPISNLKCLESEVFNCKKFNFVSKP